MTVRRMKAYTAQTGYVYQYYFVGRRSALADVLTVPATEYIFDVTADRKFIFAVSVFLRQDALVTWAAAHGRSLTDAEQYATAKLRLFQGFDEVDNMAEQGSKLVVAPQGIEELLVPLNLD